MICPYCKKEIQDENSRYCPYCAKSLTGTVIYVPTRMTRNDYLAWFGVCAAITASFWVLTWLLLK